MLALNLSILEHLHSGPAYFSPPYSRPHSPWYDVTLGLTYTMDMEPNTTYPVVSNTPFANRRSPLTPPQNYWTGTPDSSEFELLYACMKGGITMGLDSLGFDDLFVYLYARGATGFE